MRKSYLVILMLTTTLLFSLALGVIYLNQLQNKFVSPAVELVEKRKQLISGIKSGKIELTTENFLGVISSNQRSDISLIKASKNLNTVYSSLAFLLGCIALIQLIILVKNHSK
ncbi:hypothetical protein [uncultured Cocleimonas sp.]|uniref:hypothetical protein n=1 Tax=uncultured Cocleimonas sp. TaxID=1051587 RepID=UPI002623085D|nr:hypothetical protein [uncultured Cocleimonas sp.]